MKMIKDLNIIIPLKNEDAQGRMLTALRGPCQSCAQDEHTAPVALYGGVGYASSAVQISAEINKQNSQKRAERGLKTRHQNARPGFEHHRCRR